MGNDDDGNEHEKNPQMTRMDTDGGPQADGDVVSNCHE